MLHILNKYFFSFKFISLINRPPGSLNKNKKKKEKEPKKTSKENISDDDELDDPTEVIKDRPFDESLLDPAMVCLSCDCIQLLLKLDQLSKAFTVVILLLTGFHQNNQRNNAGVIASCHLSMYQETLHLHNNFKAITKWERRKNTAIILVLNNLIF